MGRYLMISNSGKVIGVRIGSEIIFGEIESSVGELNQILQPDGSFIDPNVVPVVPEKTLEERFAEVNDNQLILMDVLATMYEDMLLKGTV